jgi:type IV pilus assembly protein PilY1
MLTSRPFVRNGVVLFTTFIPPDDSDGNYDASDPCDSPNNFGTSRFWALNYKTGGAVYNFDITNDLEEGEMNEEVLARTDRYKTLASGGIAPEPTFISTAKADYVMVGTELVPEATDKRPAKSMFWRQLNRD